MLKRMKGVTLSLAIVVGMALSGLPLTSTSVNAATLLTDSFESYTSGSVPGGTWTISGGSWTIAADGTKVVSQANAATSYLISGDPTWDNYSVSAEVKPGSAAAGALSGILGRYTDGNNFYSLGLENGVLSLKKKVSGTWTTLNTASYSFTTSNYYNLKLELNGTSLKGYVNGVQLVSATDSSLTTGKIALRCTSACKYDNVAVEIIPAAYPPTNVYGAGLNGYTVAAPHPVTGITIDVTSYGANIADDANDDTAAIQAAVNAANPGDEVYFPNGTYNLISASPNDALANVVLKSGVNLRGQSEAGVVLRSSFDVNPNNSRPMILKAKAKNNIYISKMTLTSTWNRTLPTDYTNQNPDVGGPAYGIMMDNSGTTPSYNITCENVTIERFSTIAFRITGSHDIVVKNCTVKNATDIGGGGAGYAICMGGGGGHGVDTTGLGNDCYYNVADGNNIQGPYIRHGVLMQYYAHNNLAINNILDQCQQDAIDMHGEDEYKNEACYNTITNARSGAIGVGNTGSTHDAAGAYNYFHHNTIINCQKGIEVIFGSPYTIIYNNEIKNSAKANGLGISVYDGPTTVIRNNNIHDNTGTDFKGIYMGVDASTGLAPTNVKIENNTVTNNSIGVYIEAGTTSTYTGNTVTGNGLDYYHY